MAARTAERAELAKKQGGPSEPVTLTVANRLFGQEGYEFRAPFLALVKDTYGAPFQPMGFVRRSSDATQEINAWDEIGLRPTARHRRL